VNFPSYGTLGSTKKRRCDQATGATHNISAQGVYFETDVRQEVGSLVNFTLEFTLYGERHQLLCEGKVIRVERIRETGNGRTTTLWLGRDRNFVPLQIQQKEPDGETRVLRVAIQGGGCSGFQYGLGFDTEPAEGDVELTLEGVNVVVDPFSVPYLQGATVDFLTGLQESGFKIDNPNAASSCGCGHSFQVEEGAEGESAPDADVGGCKRRGIVNTVASHSNHFSLTLKLLDSLLFFMRQHICEKTIHSFKLPDVLA